MNIYDAREHMSSELLREPHHRFYMSPDASFPYYPAYVRGVFSPVFHGVGIETDESGKERLLLLSSLALDEAQKLSIEEAISGQYGWLPVNVLYAGPPLLAARPALGGDSVSSAGLSPTGTVCCRVEDFNHKIHLLSCNHVLADSHGFLPSGQVGLQSADVWQPGYNAGGTGADKIGVLSRAEPISFNTGVNAIDAAITEVSNAADIDPGIRGLGKITGVDPSPGFNISVRKNGWSTGQTQGKLRIKNLSILLTYKHGTAQFDGQYGVVGSGTDPSGHPQPYFALQGDSGGLVIDDNDKAIGMIFAVATGIDLAYVNPIEPILNKLSVTIV